MNGIDKITAKITQDVQAEIDRLNDETEAKVSEILSTARIQAEKESAEILERGKKAAAERQERLESAAQMETRKLTLAAKQEVLGEAFDLALKKLCTLPEKEYIALLTNLAVEASTTGQEKIVFSPKDRSRIGKQVVLNANSILAKKRSAAPASDSKVGNLLGKVLKDAPAAGLTMAQETRKIQGGFIMLDGDVEVNCAFETLVRLQREKLELAVAKTLFDN